VRYALYYAYGFSAIVGVAMAASWLFAINDEVYAWLRENRPLVIIVVLLSIALFLVYIGLDNEAKRARRTARRLKRRKG
jgi:hypothetical protein